MIYITYYLSVYMISKKNMYKELYALYNFMIIISLKRIKIIKKFLKENLNIIISLFNKIQLYLLTIKIKII